MYTTNLAKSYRNSNESLNARQRAERQLTLLLNGTPADQVLADKRLIHTSRMLTGVIQRETRRGSR